MIKIRQGMDVPIAGTPEQRIEPGASVRTVALVGFDYVGMKPTLEVEVGDRVKRGQVLFSDKRSPDVKFTAPAAGRVSAINRGERRVLQSLVIDVDGDEAVAFPRHDAAALAALGATLVRQQIQSAGLWPAFRTRPYSAIPAADAAAHSIFVTAIDTHPLAADPALVIAEQPEAFANGVALLTHLTEGRVFVCKAPGASLPVTAAGRVVVEAFGGPHPAGLPGTHIHFLDPVGAHRSVWHIGYQDVIAIGRLFTEGELYSQRVIALAGPQVERPRLVRTVLGASTDELVAGELEAGENRIVSGSVLGGRRAAGPLAFLGRYHNQVSVLREGREREFMGWLSPGLNKHSALGIYLSGLFGRGRKLAMTTTTNGSERAMVPMGSYERVMPLDILPTQLLRALIVGDTDVAQQLGCLELDEEDLALCTYVCPGKYEYGPILRENLVRIEKEG